MLEKTEPKYDLNNYKHGFNSPSLVDCFVKNGFVILEEALDKSFIEDTHSFISKQYLENKSKFVSKFPKRSLPSIGIGSHIASKLNSRGFLEKIKGSYLFLDILQKFLGPDLTMTDWINLRINDPDDTSLVTNKSLHQEAWTGANIDDITVWIPLHETEAESTMNLVPQSHYFGLLPNQNRKIVCPSGFKVPESIPLAPLYSGDVVLFHSLILHGTAGRGNEIRYAMSLNFKNTLAPTSRQHTKLTQVPLRLGPFTQISLGLGNDYLSPLRTYGGKVSNDQSFDPTELDD